MSRFVFPEQGQCCKMGFFVLWKHEKTRMHSSRMRTAHSSSRQPGGSAYVHAGIHSPGCWPGDPPWCGPGTPPGLGLETSWVWAWRPARHAGIHPLGDLQGMLGYHPSPPVNTITDTCKNITFPQLRLRTVKTAKNIRRISLKCSAISSELSWIIIKWAWDIGKFWLVI